MWQHRNCPKGRQDYRNLFCNTRQSMRRYWRPLLALLMLFAMMAAIAIVTDHPGQAVHATSGDWPTYLGGNTRTGYNSAEVGITAATAKSLQLNWTFPTG